MKLIGITGPTGAGKTTALSVLAQLGAEVVDCDQVYHQLLADSEPLKAALLERFGPDILDSGGRVERKRLGAVVFHDQAALRTLEELTRPFILAEIDARIRSAKAQGRPGVAIDAISIVESGLGEMCDAVVAVLAPKDLRIRRIMAREGISESYARSRVEAQKDDSFYRRSCTYVLENGDQDTRESFSERSRALFKSLLA